MSIVEQIATPTPVPRARRESRAFEAAPVRRRLTATVELVGLIALTAFGFAFVAGACAIGLIMVASNLGG